MLQASLAIEQGKTTCPGLRKVVLHLLLAGKANIKHFKHVGIAEMPSETFLVMQFEIHLQHVTRRQVSPGRAVPLSE